MILFRIIKVDSMNGSFRWQRNWNTSNLLVFFLCVIDFCWSQLMVIKQRNYECTETPEVSLNTFVILPFNINMHECISVWKKHFFPIFSHINILFISEYILVLRCLFDREELLSTWFPLFALLKTWEITANERTSVVANIHTNAIMNGVGSKAEEQIYW